MTCSEQPPDTKSSGSPALGRPIGLKRTERRQDEVTRFLGALHRLTHLLILTAYYTGLPVSEAVRLKSAAIDSRRMVIRLIRAKA